MKATISACSVVLLAFFVLKLPVGAQEAARRNTSGAAQAAPVRTPPARLRTADRGRGRGRASPTPRRRRSPNSPNCLLGSRAPATAISPSVPTMPRARK